MEITHLVTNGCSFTFGDELDDPKTQAWPALLAKKLGVPIVNLALPGTGNDCILRRTTEYLYEDNSRGGKPLVVIAWSQDWRREEWFQHWYNERNYNNYGIVCFPKEKANNHYEYALLENLSDEDTFRKTLQRKIAMKNLLTTLNVPYITTKFAHNDYNQAVVDKLCERFASIVNIIEHDEYKVDDMYILANQYPKCPNGHNGPEAQVAVADYMYQKINELHGKIRPIINDYLTLKEFMKYETYALPLNWFHWVDAN